MSRCILVILALAFLAGCPNPELKKARADLEKLQSSNTKLLADKQTCEAKLSELQDLHSQTCNAVEELNIQRASQTVQVSQDAVACNDLKVEITKLDEGRGWVYLKYQKEENVGFSDRLWFESKPDRGVLLIDGQTLLQVQSCTDGSCQVMCRKLLPDEYVCKTP